MMRRQSLDGEILFIMNPDDATHALRRAFLANLVQMSDLSFPVESDYMSATMEIEEVIG